MTVKRFQGASWECNGCGRKVETRKLSENFDLPKWWFSVNHQVSVRPNHRETLHFCSRGCLTKWAMAKVVVTDEDGREFTWDGSVFKVEKKEEKAPF